MSEITTWMQTHRATLPPNLHPAEARIETVRAYRNAHRETAQRLGLRALVDAYSEAVRLAALTLDDIPAGQGAASLFLRRAGNGETELWFKRSGGVPFCMDILDAPDAGTEDFALRDHLAATLPTIDA